MLPGAARRRDDRRGRLHIAGFLAALLRGEGPVQAATSATAVGAASVEAPDATSGVPPWPELAARIRAGWERHPLTLTRPDKEPA